jgi:hypothetical protein
MNVTGGRLHRGEQIAAQLVVQPLAADNPFRRIDHVGVTVEPIPSRLTPGGPVQSLDDVRALPERAEAFAPPLLKPPPAAGDRPSEGEPLQRSKPGEKQRALSPPYPGQRAGGELGAGSHDFVEPAVEGRQAIAFHLGAPLAGEVPLGAQAELLRDDLLGSPPHVLLDVAGWDAEVPAIGIHSADDDVDVRMLGVVVIDGGPDKRPSEVRAHPVHEPPRERVEV